MTQDHTQKPLRADAARNRILILQAATEVFREHGLEVTLDDIALHAGLGVATVYRRFTNKETLIEALFDQQLRDTASLAQAALENDDPWNGLITLIHTICQKIAADRGFRQIMLSSRHGLEQVAMNRNQLLTFIERLIEQVHLTGKLRAGFAGSDIPILFLMMSSVADFTGDIKPQLWERYYEFLIDGIRSQSHQVEQPKLKAMTTTQMTTAMSTWKSSRHN
jgi:AcrR family transcriptional regulator